MKPNLVIIPSLFTNSHILSGLIEYLKNYFEVYFIDFPGFIYNKPGETLRTFEDYAKYAEKEIASCDIGQFVICGISFGFGVISHMKIDNNCSHIFAVEPYVGSSSMKQNIVQKIIARIISNSNVLLYLSSKMWKSSLIFLANKYLLKLPENIIIQAKDDFDIKTLIIASNLVLSYKGNVPFHKIPHTLIANKNDDCISYEWMEKLFKENVQNLNIINVNLSHYPNNLSKEFFSEELGETFSKFSMAKAFN